MATPPIKIRDSPEDLDQDKNQRQKEENYEDNKIKEVSTKIPKIPDGLIYEDPGINIPTNILIEEYLEKVNQRYELEERLEAFYFEYNLLQTQKARNNIYKYINIYNFFL